MLNYLWGGMILLGIVYGALSGNMEAVTESIMNSAKEAITLALGMVGIMAMWSGFLEIASRCGLLEKGAKILGPMITFLFPNIPRRHPARTAIATNFSANILGLGWAATPAGLSAMEELSNMKTDEAMLQQYKSDKNNKGLVGVKILNTDSASDEMCTFLVMNISSLQLLPMTIIAYRSQYGSVNPMAVIGPGLVATATSTLVAIVFCKIMCRRKKQRIGEA